VDQPDLARPDGVAVLDDVDRLPSRIDLDQSPARSRDRHVARGVEQRSYLAYRTPHVNAVEEPARLRNCDGREYTDYREGYHQLDERERGAHLSFCRETALDSI